MKLNPLSVIATFLFFLTVATVIKDDDKLFVPEWESSDPAVAKVDQSGLVSMVGPGTATVTASYGNTKSNPCVVTCT